MPLGYLTTVLVFGFCVLILLAPVSRSRLLGVASFWSGLLVNEQPHWFALILAASTGLAVAGGDIRSTAGWVVVAAGVLVFFGLLLLLIRADGSRSALRDAVSSLGEGAVGLLGGERSHTVSLLAPFAFGRRGVERIGDISYGPAGGKANLLDLYRPRGRNATGPTLIYLHGGRFRSGDKRREAQPIHYRLAGRGWTVISANYRLNPEGQFPDYLIDLKRVIAWVRSEGHRHGADPGPLFLAGGSAGGHIAAMGGLTAGLTELQPGFEEADTSVSGVIGMYGYYGGLEPPGSGPSPGIATSPRRHVGPESPPFLLIHGGHDSLVPARGARAMADRLRAAGVPAAFAELPGAEHTFDLLRSVRIDNSIDAIEDFAAWVSENHEKSAFRR